jgi:putative PIN family toxin of toxin-antitoxin system
VKVFLDTNVLISGFTARGLCADLLRFVISRHEPMTGEVVLAELERVLTLKFKAPRAAVDAALSTMREHHVEPKPTSLPAAVIRDRDDLWVLASAIAAGADLLVTGDKDLLDEANQITDVAIIDPRSFWMKYRPA